MGVIVHANEMEILHRTIGMLHLLRQTFGISPISFGKLIGIKFVRSGLNSGPIAIPQTMPVSVWRWNKVGKENSVN